jgi:hypothetical protein
MSRLIAAAAVLLVFAAGAVKWFGPSLTLQRETVDSTPSLQGKDVRSVVEVPRGGRACIGPLPVDAQVRAVQLLLHSAPRPGSADLTLRAAGYTGRARVGPVAAGRDVVSVARLDRAPPVAGDGRLCVRNRGGGTLGLVGTTEAESLSRPSTTVDGTPVPDNDPAVTFLVGEKRDIPSQAGTIAGRIADFTGALPSWLVWFLGALVFLGMPVATAAVILLASRRP